VTPSPISEIGEPKGAKAPPRPQSGETGAGARRRIGVGAS
jgi:hypothetical protein